MQRRSLGDEIMTKWQNLFPTWRVERRENGVSGKPTLAERVAERPTMVPIAGGSARPSRRC